MPFGVTCSQFWNIYLKPTQVDTVRFISDSPATQYRCKTNFFLFCTRFYDNCCGRVKADVMFCIVDSVCFALLIQCG